MEVNASNIAISQTTGVSGTQTSTKTEDTKTVAEMAESSEAAAAKTAETTEAAVYEKSSDTAKTTDGSVAAKPAKQDRSAIIAQMKADLETRQNQLLDIVRKTMQGQGKAIGQADDMWKFLAGGNFEVDPATKAQAQADIAEDGYWGVKQTSDRMVDFAKALAGDDPSKADKMIEAFKKGYEQATKSWGKELPDISKQTYDSTIKKLEEWRDSANKTSDDTTKAAADTTAQANATAATATEG